MRIFEIIKLSMEYNELLVNYLKGKLFLDNPNKSPELKDKFIPRWNNLLNRLDSMLKQLEDLNISFGELEAIQYIKLPDELKRKNVEIFLEDYYKNENFNVDYGPNQEQKYVYNERQGIKLF